MIWTRQRRHTRWIYIAPAWALFFLAERSAGATEVRRHPSSGPRALIHHADARTLLLLHLPPLLRPHSLHSSHTHASPFDPFIFYTTLLIFIYSFFLFHQFFVLLFYASLPFLFFLFLFLLLLFFSLTCFPISCNFLILNFLQLIFLCRFLSFSSFTSDFFSCLPCLQFQTITHTDPEEANSAMLPIQFGCKLSPSNEEINVRYWETFNCPPAECLDTLVHTRARTHTRMHAHVRK